MAIPAAQTQPAVPGPAHPAPADAAGGRRGDRFGFWDFIDIINPLQHIPVVNALYRELTGDAIKPAARIIGGTVFGGPVGLAVAAADAVIEQSTGRTVGGHVAEAIGLIEDDRPTTGDGGPSAGRQAMVPADPSAGAAGPVPSLTLSLDPVPPEASAVPAAATASGAADGLRFYDLPARRGPTGMPLDRASAIRTAPLPVDRSSAGENPAAPAIPPTRTVLPAEPPRRADTAPESATASEPGGVAFAPAADPEPGAVASAPAADPRRAARIDAALQSLAGDAAGTDGHPMLADRLNVSQAMLAALDRYSRAQTLAE